MGVFDRERGAGVALKTLTRLGPTGIFPTEATVVSAPSAPSAPPRLDAPACSLEALRPAPRATEGKSTP
jgi:hypothetical protein